jgi:hypothetical protein
MGLCHSTPGYSPTARSLGSIGSAATFGTERAKAPRKEMDKAVRLWRWPSAPALRAGGWLTATRRSRLFFYSSFSLLDCVHAANHEGRKISLHNLFFARFFAAKHLPRNLGLPNGLFVFGTYTGNCVVERKSKSRKKYCDQNDEIDSDQMLLLFLNLHPILPIGERPQSEASLA